MPEGFFLKNSHTTSIMISVEGVPTNEKLVRRAPASSVPPETVDKFC